MISVELFASQAHVLCAFLKHCAPERQQAKIRAQKQEYQTATKPRIQKWDGHAVPVPMSEHQDWGNSLSTGQLLCDGGGSDVPLGLSSSVVRTPLGTLSPANPTKLSRRKRTASPVAAGLQPTFSQHTADTFLLSWQLCIACLLRIWKAVTSAFTTCGTTTPSPIEALKASGHA